MNKDTLSPFIKDNRIVWTMTTNAYKYYTLNLIASFPLKLCVICCDESYGFFRREGIPCVYYDACIKGQTSIACFGTENFAKWNRVKLDILQWFYQNSEALGIRESLYLDGDIVVRRDPWPTLEKEFHTCPLLFQCDCVGGEDHEGCGNICSGVIAERYGTPHTIYEFDPEQWISSKKQDQPYIQGRLHVPYKTLKRSLFGNGHWQMSERWRNDDWILLHYNYRVGNTKKSAMKKYKHWFIPY